MGLKVDKPFGVVVRFSVTDACFELEDTFEEVHNLVETPLEGSHDVFMHEVSPSLGFDYIILPNPLDHSHISPMYLQPSPSSEYYIIEPIDNPMICSANVDFGYKDNVFDVLARNVYDYVSLCCL